MPLDLATLIALAPSCAPAVAPATLLAVAKVESGFDPLVIGVNGHSPRRLSFSDPAKAAQAARTLITSGRNIDLGLGQVNVRNLGWLGLSVDAAFDPCRNLAASAQVLRAGFEKALPASDGEQAAVRTALSYYNTGRPDRGFANGYVAKVVGAAERMVPALAPADTTSGPPSPPKPNSRPAWAVFGTGSATPFVLIPSNGVQP